MKDSESLPHDWLQPERPFIDSRPFNSWRWSNSPKLNACVDGLMAELEAHEGRKRRRTQDEADRFYRCIGVLVFDLYTAVLIDPNLKVG